MYAILKTNKPNNQKVKMLGPSTNDSEVQQEMNYTELLRVAHCILCACYLFLFPMNSGPCTQSLEAPNKSVLVERVGSKPSQLLYGRSDEGASTPQAGQSHESSTNNHNNSQGAHSVRTKRSQIQHSRRCEQLARRVDARIRSRTQSKSGGAVPSPRCCP